MRRLATCTALLALLVGCNAEKQETKDTRTKRSAKAADAPPAPPSDDELKDLLSGAASVPGTVFDRIVSSATMRPDGFVDRPLTVVMLTMDMSVRDPDPATKKAREEELTISGPTPSPSALADAFRPNRWTYASVIRPEYITACTRKVDGETMTGVVSFRAKDVYHGRVEYTARHSRRGWEVVEFRLPAHGYRTRRNAKGLWEVERLQ